MGVKGEWVMKMSREDLYELYVRKGMSLQEIGDMYSVSISTVSNMLKRLQIQSRPPADRRRTNWAGQRVGNWLVTDKFLSNGGRHPNIRWLCICTLCGKFRYVVARSLATNKSKQCSSCSGLKKRAKFNIVPKKYYLNIARGAKARELRFDIDLEYIEKLLIKQNFKCALSGVEIGFEYRNYTASLDRINGDIGYTETNVQWVHKTVNDIKGILTDAELINWSKRIAKNQPSNEYVNSSFLLY